MALRLGQARGEDLADLIARRQYAKAIEIIKDQVRSQKADMRVRLQLADVLVLANRPQEAVAVLLPLADEYAREGFAAKAVAVLKRIQKIDPRRRDIESRLAALIEEKQRHATVPIASVPARVEFGFEEIQPGLEIGIEPLDEDEAPAAAAAEPAPVEDRDLAFGNAAPVELAPELVLEPEPPPVQPAAPVEAAAEPEIVLEPEPVATEPAIVLDPIVEPEAEARGSASPLGDDLFAQELMAVLEDVFPTGPAPAVAPPVEPTPGVEAGLPDDGSLRQIVVSPLFRDFSVDEIVAVIQGLKLLCYEAGEIIISEGEPGDSLYMLSSGRVKAFKRNAVGRQILLGEMSEGAFFGEISVLTGKPRSATVVAASACELLELDRGTLGSITTSHPHVWDVLREYADRRMKAQRS